MDNDINECDCLISYNELCQILKDLFINESISIFQMTNA